MTRHRSSLFNEGAANMGARLAGVVPQELSNGRQYPARRPAHGSAQAPDRAAPDAAHPFPASGEELSPVLTQERACGPALRTGRRTPDGLQSEARPGADRFELMLSDGVQAVLLLAAKAAGTTPGDFVARAICAYAQEAVGFPALCDELYLAPEPARPGASRFRTFDAADGEHSGIPP